MWYSTAGCIVMLTLGLLAAPLAAHAQPPTRVHRITAVADEIARVARDVQGDLCRQLGRIPRIWPRSASRFSVPCRSRRASNPPR